MVAAVCLLIFRKIGAAKREESPPSGRRAKISLSLFYEVGRIVTKDFIDEGSPPFVPSFLRRGGRGNRQGRHITNVGEKPTPEPGERGKMRIGTAASTNSEGVLPRRNNRSVGRQSVGRSVGRGRRSPADLENRRQRSRQSVLRSFTQRTRGPTLVRPVAEDRPAAADAEEFITAKGATKLLELGQRVLLLLGERASEPGFGAAIKGVYTV